VNAETDAATAEVAARAGLLQAEEAALAEDATLVELLEAAKTHLQRHPDRATCPLCQSPDRALGLADRVQERISAVAQMKSLADGAKRAYAQMQAKAAARLGALERAKVAAGKACAAARLAPPDWQATHEAAIQALEASAQTDSIDLPLDAAALRAVAEDASMRRTQLETAAGQLRSVKAALTQHDENIARQATLSAVLPRLQQALEICERQRKRYLEALLAAIAVEVGRLYEAVHPGEGLNKIAFRLAPNRKGSLDIGAEFLGAPDRPPQAYFSDSHLDTLGLCIFLALAAREAPEETVLVLDDVLGSIDEPHVDRLINVLYQEALKFRHTVLTTHYRPWREKFRWGWLPTAQCEFIELGAWSPGGGIVYGGNSLSPLAELRQHLAARPPALQAACAAAGVMLERACDFLVDLYELDVPRKRSGLTLADLLPRVAEKRLAATLRVEVKQADGSYAVFPLGERLGKLRDTMQVRNVFGAHYNTLAEHLPPQDATAFAQSVAELMSALVCDEHGWPKSPKSGSYWATREETRRLHPLKRPQ
jgi:hypothetical protein